MIKGDALIDQITRSRIIAVVVIDSADNAVPLADALTAGGISAIELTLRTPAALESIRRIHAERPDILVGAGTVLTSEQVRDAKAAGASFAVSPGLNPSIVRAAQEAGVPFFPGVMTPSEIEGALALGCRLMKFFPAEPAGGISLLNAIAAPYAHLEVRFIPLGGLTLASAKSYFEHPAVAAIGGSWIAQRNLIQERRFDEITERARQAMALS